jgi:hypothetical protein
MIMNALNACRKMRWKLPKLAALNVIEFLMAS